MRLFPIVLKIVFLKLQCLVSYLETWLKCRFQFKRSGCGLGFCISNKLPGDMNSADLKSTLLSDNGLLQHIPAASSTAQCPPLQGRTLDLWVVHRPICPEEMIAILCYFFYLVVSFKNLEKKIINERRQTTGYISHGSWNISSLLGKSWLHWMSEYPAAHHPILV